MISSVVLAAPISYRHSLVEVASSEDTHPDHLQVNADRALHRVDRYHADQVSNLFLDRNSDRNLLCVAA